MHRLRCLARRRRAAHALIHGIVADNQSQHRRRRNGRDPLLFYADNAEGAKIKDDKQNGSLSLTRGAKLCPIEIDVQTQDRQHVLADPALLEMEWNGAGAIGVAPLY